MYEEEPRSLLDMLGVAYGAIIVVVGMVVVVALALFGLGRSEPVERPLGVRAVASPTIDIAAVMRANPAMATTTYYLVYSPEQAQTISDVHARTVQASSSRRFVDMFASFVVLPISNADETVIAKDVIDRAYNDYFAGRGPWVTVVDTANWCRNGSAMPTDWIGLPNEITRAIADTCGPSLAACSACSS